MSIELGGNEPKKIHLGQNVADMQGPCPTGFHVPTKDENVALVAAMTALGIDTSNGNCMKTYLKMPFAGRRLYSSAGVNSRGSNALYWSSTAYSADYAYCLYFYSAELYPHHGSRRSDGFSVRCFKNSPLQPTSSWTTLFDGSGIAAGAGIFHNTTDGVISISSDGTNWITIADKNLGATTVYNDGDTLSQANCGNYYQRGNNYGFPRTGSVTTSSTQIDASNYGPGNYYNSSTFITRSSSPYDWSTVQNDNLRGGVSGGEKEVKKIMMRPGGVEVQIRPVGWKPGANTIAYYPLNGDALDYSGNGYNGTRQYGGHYATGIGGKQCGDFSRTYAEFLSSSCSVQPKTVMWFMKRCDLYATQRDRRQIIGQTSNWGTNGWCFRSKPTAYNSSSIQGLFVKRNPEQNYTDTSMVDLNWHHFALTSDNSNTYLYFDGVLKKTYSGSLATNGSSLKVGKTGANTDYELNAYMQYIILESVQWTQQDIQDYLSNFSY